MSIHPATPLMPDGVPPVHGGSPNRSSDVLAHEVTCRLCGTGIRTMAELEVVATTPVHSACLRNMMIMGWQLAHNLRPDASV